jgi:hypothetical protein
MRHGYGLWRDSDNTSSYEGEWVSNMRHGFGMATDAVRQELFVGEFAYDKRHGRGTIESLINGSTREVTYNRGQIVEEQEQSSEKQLERPSQPVVELIKIENVEQPADEQELHDELATLRLKTQQQEQIITRLGFQAQAIEALEAKLQIATSQQQALKETLEERSLCAICMERNKNCAFAPCGHVLCEECAKTQKNCPFCSKLVSSKLILFL